VVAESQVQEGEVVIETAEGAMPAFEARPHEDVRGAVVVIQEAFGLTPHIHDVTRRLAAEGWRAVAPALFHRQGSPVLAYDDFNKVMPVMSQLTKEGLTVDLEATFEHLAFPAERTGIVGFCMGGTVAFYAATLRALGAAVTFYGGGVAQGRFGLPPQIELAAELKSPWLGLYGDRDQSIATKDVERLRQALAEAPVQTEIVRYEDAEHGFNCNDRPSYHPEAANDAWQRTLAWFDRHLV
jgi:carboxymethylenebutenolidase